MRISRMLIGVALLSLFLAGCSQVPARCPSPAPVDLSGAGAYAGDETLPFRMPLDDEAIFTSSEPIATEFATFGQWTRGMEHHAAEDILQPAGAPVYAMADGIVSYSGPREGYGWLVIIDHPQANIYSLYGHLSPSRWQIATGSAKKGELIAYLGDADENGGTPETPLRPHLHFGVRVGQRSDYPTAGTWRWQAGWIPACPQDVGWVQPSAVITGQQIPDGGFDGPAGSFLTRFWLELLFPAIYVFGGVCMIVYAIRKNRPIPPLVYGAIMLAGGVFLHFRGWKMSYILFALAGLLLVMGAFLIVRKTRRDRLREAG